MLLHEAAFGAGRSGLRMAHYPAGSTVGIKDTSYQGSIENSILD